MTELAADGIDATPQVLDVADPRSIAAAATRVGRESGKLDVLVNNAGIIDSGDGLPTATATEVLRQTYQTNVLGVAAVTNAFLPLLRAAGSSRVVNMSSALASLTLIGDPTAPEFQLQMLAYNSSKTAVNALTVMFANELRADGILVNAADPGHCATDMGGPTAPRTAAQGAAVAVRLALLGADGPSGELHGEAGRLPW